MPLYWNYIFNRFDFKRPKWMTDADSLLEELRQRRAESRSRPTPRLSPQQLQDTVSTPKATTLSPRTSLVPSSPPPVPLPPSTPASLPGTPSPVPSPAPSPPPTPVVEFLTPTPLLGERIAEYDAKLTSSIPAVKGARPMRPTDIPTNVPTPVRESLAEKVGGAIKTFFDDPGAPGVLADLAMAFSARDPKSWQHQLGSMVAMKATADVYRKYAKNLQDIIAGKEPGEKLTRMEAGRLSPELQAEGLTAAIKGRELGQAERRLEQTGEYYKTLADYYKALEEKLGREPTEEEKARMKYILTAKPFVETFGGKDLLFEPRPDGGYDIYEAPHAYRQAGEMTRSRQATLLAGILDDAHKDPEVQKYGDIVRDEATGETRFVYTDPKGYKEAYRNAALNLVRMHEELGNLEKGTYDRIKRLWDSEGELIRTPDGKLWLKRGEEYIEVEP